jgi:hypothetical protein
MGAIAARHEPLALLGHLYALRSPPTGRSTGLLARTAGRASSARSARPGEPGRSLTS